MGLFAAIWQKLAWCALSGGLIGMALGVVGLFQKEPSQQPLQSVPSDLIVAGLAGTLFGLILLGVPASIWVVGKWAIHGGKLEAPSTPNGTHAVTQEAGHAAMVGSAAAIPGAILGAVTGVVLAVMVLGLLMVISFIAGVPYFDYTLKHFLLVGFGSAAAIGALVGFLGGSFLGSALGALFGGVRAMARQ